MWPSSFDDYKSELENWLNLNHPNYLKELGERKWANSLVGNHHTMVIIINYLYKHDLIINLNFY
jgi:hypothetical protein